MLRSLLYIWIPLPIQQIGPNFNLCAPEAATLTMSQKAFQKRSTNGSQPAITKNNAPNKSRETYGMNNESSIPITWFFLKFILKEDFRL